MTTAPVLQQGGVQRHAYERWQSFPVVSVNEMSKIKYYYKSWRFLCVINFASHHSIKMR